MQGGMPIAAMANGRAASWNKPLAFKGNRVFDAIK